MSAAPQFVRTLGAWADDADRAASGLDALLERNPVARITDVTLRASDSHSHHFADQAPTVFLAECRVLVLSNPNPMPSLRLFRWLP